MPTNKTTTTTNKVGTPTSKVERMLGKAGVFRVGYEVFLFGIVGTLLAIVGMYRLTGNGPREVVATTVATPSGATPSNGAGGCWVSFDGNNTVFVKNGGDKDSATACSVGSERRMVLGKDGLTLRKTGFLQGTASAWVYMVTSAICLGIAYFLYVNRNSESLQAALFVTNIMN